jgi:hypothetical protein
MPSSLRDYEINNLSVKQALKDSPQLASDAIKKELQQMLEKKVFHPVKHCPIKPIPSKMFFKKKLDSKGALVKWKARLVAGGHLQSPDDTVIRSSPTIHHNSFMLASLIAADSTRCVLAGRHDQ